MKNISTEMKNPEKKYTRKRAMIWLLVLPPYGLFRLIKHKHIHIGLGIALVVLFSIIMLVSINTITSPYAIQDKLAFSSIKEFNKSNTKVGLGNVRKVLRIGNIEVKTLKYDKYELLTNKGKYVVYYGMDKNKDYSVEAIYRTIPNEELEYVSTGSKKVLTETFPEIITFLEKEKVKFGEYKALIDDIDKNVQQIKTSNGIYNILVLQNQVCKVTKIHGDKSTIVIDVTPKINLIPELVKLAEINKETIGEIKEVIKYTFYPNKEAQTVITEKGEYILEYTDDGDYDILKRN